MKIRTKGPGVLTAWVERGVRDEELVFIRESLDRGKDVQTVCITWDELGKIQKLKGESE